MRTFLGLMMIASSITVAAAAHAQPAEPPQPLPVAPQPPPVPTAPPDAAPLPPPQPATPQQPPSPPAGHEHEHEHEHGHEHGEHGHGGWNEHRPWLGVLGWGSIGYLAGDFSALQTSLQAPAALGPGFDVAPMGLTYGGGLGAFFGPVWVGGRAYGMHVATTPHGSADTSLTGFGGGGELGVVACASERWLVVPYVGFGGYGYSLKITNKSAAPLPVFTNENIAAGAQNSFTASVLTGEIGIRANRVITFGDGSTRGGLTIGGEIGYMSSLTRDAWVGADNTVAPESAAIRGAYFRLLLGGGALFFNKD